MICSNCGTENTPGAKFCSECATRLASVCPACGTAITALQNIPLASWIALGGKCAACKAPISVRYPLVELATGLLAFHITNNYVDLTPVPLASLAAARREVG